MFLTLLLACAHHDATEHPLLLWRVEKEGHVSHLLGTCHLGVDLDYALPAPQDAALTGARVVYTEADLALGDPSRALRLLMNLGPPLSEKLAPEDWRAVAVHLRDTMPASLLDRMQPWIVATLLSSAGSMDAKAAGQAMDREVQRRAEAKGIPRAYVETLEGQAKLLADWNDTFLQSLHPSPPATAEGHALADLCYRGETSDITALVNPADPMTEPLILARNRAWIPTLRPDLEQGGAFVAVGAAHMLGDQGLVALLRGEGFTVTQLTTTRPIQVGALGAPDEGLPAAPPASPQTDAIAQKFPGVMAESACVPGQMLTTCFEPDIERCRGRVRADARLCVLQYADQLPAKGDVPFGMFPSLAACSVTGLTVEAIATDHVGSAPQCQQMVAKMRAATGG